jgi:hypothetical protein
MARKCVVQPTDSGGQPHFRSLSSAVSPTDTLS